MGEAFVQAEHSERLHRALFHNIQTSVDIKYVTGDQVYYKHSDGLVWHSPDNVLDQDGQ